MQLRLMEGVIAIMSNLDLYQTMTTLSKKVGGSKQFILILLGCGYGIGRFTEAGIKKVFKVIREYVKNNGSPKTYHIVSDSKSNEGVTFSIGDTFQVLERDKDAVLIENRATMLSHILYLRNYYNQYLTTKNEGVVSYGILFKLWTTTC